MRARRALAVVIGVIAVVLFAGRWPTPASQRTARAAVTNLPAGIRGRVLLGPTCPVQRAGQSCVRPYQATLSVTAGTSGRIIRRVRSGTDGRFTVTLAAGRYLLVPQGGTPYPRADPQLVIVRPGRYTSVVVRYDTGIR